MITNLAEGLALKIIITTLYGGLRLFNMSNPFLDQRFTAVIFARGESTSTRYVTAMFIYVLFVGFLSVMFLIFVSY